MRASRAAGPRILGRVRGRSVAGSAMSANVEHGRDSRGARGFGLIEVMVIVVILAIFAVIALPSYTLISNRINRTTGKALLLQLARKEDAYFSEHKRYAPIPLLSSLPGNFAYLGGDGHLSASANAHSVYRISAVQLAPGGAAGSACSGSGVPNYDYLLIAAPMNAQNGDSRCMTLCFASTREKGATGSEGPQACWE